MLQCDGTLGAGHVYLVGKELSAFLPPRTMAVAGRRVAQLDVEVALSRSLGSVLKRLHDSGLDSFFRLDILICSQLVSKLAEAA
jgi:hypothetical protein